MDKAKVCVGYLLEIGKSWQCATNIAGILRRLMAEQVKPLLGRRILDGKTVSTSQPNKAQDNNMAHPQTSSSAPGRSRKGSASSRAAKQTAVRGGGRKQRSLISTGSPRTSDVSSAVRVDNGFLQLSPPIIQTSPSLSPLSTGTDTLGSPPPIASPPSSDLGSLFSPTASSPMSLSSPEVIYLPSHSDQSSHTAPQPTQYLQARYDYSQPSLPYTGMELSGFLAMLGGQTIPDVPYMPPFSMGDGAMDIGGIPTSVSETAMLMDQGAPVSDADLQFWNDYYRAEQGSSTVATTEAANTNSDGNPDGEYNTEMVMVELGQERDEAWMRYFT
ncbi:hypothetical protein BDQ12DRAFT_730023 [Crucibulum laeve]|uniref:Uncharacterized protein n=1 Tax=Crucibulum laeve TaxID=68775 RepID=A0A5C3LQJ7_9AGAR|nr:hypothetical protein BDQ12DRAFT_730023 [Crucibulum laeve]